MSNHKIVFLSRVVVILPSISFRKSDIYCVSLLKWQLHATTRETLHANILNMATTIFHHVFLRF